MKRLFLSTGFLIAVLALAGCGSPTLITARNVANTTVTPVVVTVVVTAVPNQATAAATSAEMPGMAMATNPPKPTISGTSAPGETPFVLIDILNAPTATPGAATVAPTAAATTASKATSAATAPSASSGSSDVKGDPAKGKALFNGSAGCNACHDVQAGITIVGPSLKGVANRAGTRKPGVSAADYIRESIQKPNAYVVQGFQGGLMPQNFAQILKPAQIEDLVAYLLTLNK